MSKQSTVLTNLKIDVSPDGITFTIEGLDTDLAKLIEQAVDFKVEPVEFLSHDSSTVTIKSTKMISFVDRPAT
jgi:hypothetical protein